MSMDLAPFHSEFCKNSKKKIVEGSAGLADPDPLKINLAPDPLNKKLGSGICRHKKL